MSPRDWLVGVVLVVSYIWVILELVVGTPADASIRLLVTLIAQDAYLELRKKS